MTGYNYFFTVPAGTPFDKPFIIEKGVKPGMITNLHVEFPYGCNRLVFIKIMMGERALVPDDKGEWLRGNGHLYPYQMDFIVEPMEGDIKIICASPECTLDHVINVGFGHSSKPIPDTLTPAMMGVQRSIDVLNNTIMNSQIDQRSILEKIKEGLIGGISRHTR